MTQEERRARHDRVCAIAAGQRGLVTRDQARACGYSDRQIDGRVARGDWRRIAPRVFYLGPRGPDWMDRALAFCLAGGPDVAASHRTAARLWGLDGFAGALRDERIHLSAPRRVRGGRPGVVVHETDRPFAIRHVDGIPVTSVERTLVDVAVKLQTYALEVALEDGLRRRLTTIERVRTEAEDLAGPGRPGAGRLLGLLTDRGLVAAAESPLEVRVWRALRGAAIRGLVRQYPFTRADGSVGRIDLALPAHRIAIEVDGYRWHSGRRAWRRDLARRNELTALGWTVLHATSEDADAGCATLIDSIRRLESPNLFHQ